MQTTIDFSNNGLIIPGEKSKEVKNLNITSYDHYTVCVSAVIEGINIFI